MHPILHPIYQTHGPLILHTIQSSIGITGNTSIYPHMIMIVIGEGRIIHSQIGAEIEPYMNLHIYEVLSTQQRKVTPLPAPIDHTSTT